MRRGTILGLGAWLAVAGLAGAVSVCDLTALRSTDPLPDPNQLPLGHVPVDMGPEDDWSAIQSLEITFVGRVVDHLGRPVSGAQVAAFRTSRWTVGSAAQWRCRTDAGGWFVTKYRRLGGADGPWRFAAAHPSRSRPAVRRQVLAGDRCAVQIVMPPPDRAAVRLRGFAGERSPELQASAGRPHSDALETSAWAAPAGGGAWQRIGTVGVPIRGAGWSEPLWMAPGRWRLRLVTLDAPWLGLEREVIVSAREAADLTCVLQPLMRMTGQVVDVTSGDPVSGVRVRWHRSGTARLRDSVVGRTWWPLDRQDGLLVESVQRCDSDGWMALEVVTGADGRFPIPVWKAEGVSVELRHYGRARGPQVVPPGRRELELTIDAQPSLQLTEPAPQAGQRVVALVDGRPPAMSERRRSRHWLRGSLDPADFHGLSAAPHVVWVWATRSGDGALRDVGQLFLIDLAESGAIQHELQLQPLERIQLRVLDAAGEYPLTGVWVRFSWKGHRFADTSTDKSGTADYPLPPGMTVSARLSAVGYEPSTFELTPKLRGARSRVDVGLQPRR